MNEQQQILERVKQALGRFDCVKSECIDILAQAITNNDLTIGGVFLTADEKKSLGLNARTKYTQGLIACFDLSKCKDFDVKAFCTNMLYTERSIVMTLNNIARDSKNSVVTGFMLEGVGAWNDKIVKKNNIPPFPNVDYRKERVLFFATVQTQ